LILNDRKISRELIQELSDRAEDDWVPFDIAKQEGMYLSVYFKYVKESKQKPTPIFFAVTENGVIVHNKDLSSLLLNKKWAIGQIKLFQNKSPGFNLSNYIISVVPSLSIGLRMGSIEVVHPLIKTAQLMPKVESYLMKTKFHRDHILHQVRVAVLLRYILRELLRSRNFPPGFSSPHCVLNGFHPDIIMSIGFLAGLFHDIGLTLTELRNNERMGDILGRDFCQYLLGLFSVSEDITPKDVNAVKNLDLNNHFYYKRKEFDRFFLPPYKEEFVPKISVLALLRVFSLPLLGLPTLIVGYGATRNYFNAVFPPHTQKSIKELPSDVVKQVNTRGLLHALPSESKPFYMVLNLRLVHTLYEELIRGYQSLDHGVIAALSLMRGFVNWELSQAIAHHNLSNIKINDVGFPYSCLLVLCDELQEWDRPFSFNPNMQTMNSIEIKINENSIEATLDYRKSNISYGSPWKFEKALKDKISNLGRMQLFYLKLLLRIIDLKGNEYKIFNCHSCKNVISDNIVDEKCEIEQQNECPFCNESI